MQHFGHLKRRVDPFLRVVENGHEVWLRRIAKTLPDVKLLDAPLGRSIRKFKRICSNVTARPSNLLPGALHACKPTVSLIVFVARTFCGILSVVSLDWEVAIWELQDTLPLCQEKKGWFRLLTLDFFSFWYSFVLFTAGSLWICIPCLVHHDPFKSLRIFISELVHAHALSQCNPCESVE